MARDPKHDVLFDTVRIGPKQTRNRFWQTSHCAGPGAERPGAQAHFRGMKAEGGWGVVFTEFCSIHPESDEYPCTSARIWDQGDVVNLGHMCEIAHRHGALPGFSCGTAAAMRPNLESREIGRSPSQWPSTVVRHALGVRREMDELDIQTVINMYVEAGKRARGRRASIWSRSRLGDDTLPLQFLEPRFNRRTDRLRRQLRQPLALLTSNCCKRSSAHLVTAAASPRVSRWTPCTAPRGSRRTRMECGSSSSCAARASVDRGRSRSAITRNGARMRELSFSQIGWMTPFVKHVKSIVGPNIPVVGNGRLTSPDDMVAALIAAAQSTSSAPRAPSSPIPSCRRRSPRIVSTTSASASAATCASRAAAAGAALCTQNATVGEEYRRGWHPEKFDRDRRVLAACSWSGQGRPAWSARWFSASAAIPCTCATPRAELGGHWRCRALPRLAEYGAA